MQRSKNLALMFLLGALLVGGALGFSADRLFSRDPVCAVSTNHESWRDQFAKELGLTSEQRVAVDRILDKRHQDFAAIQGTIRPRIDSLQATVHPQMDSVRDHARADISKLLDPSQQAVFQRLIRESHSNQRHRENRKR
ncbi:MAG TPA: hypothetical protein VFW98_01070 [Gemmatimonadaceae bacterium]|nr:hypothetical protein [Gemmatimonadaceae bacterium]